MSESAAATLTVVEINPTTFQYNITLQDTGPTAIGSFWLAWLPGENFLPDPAIGEATPAGWSANPIDLGSNGNSVQFIASSTSSYLQSGGTLAGFSFTSHDSPAVVLGESTLFPPTPVLTSVAFKAGILVDSGGTFDVSCFAAGTRILTADGEIPVEQLALGDLVPTLTGAGLAPIRWLGHRTIDCRRHPRPAEVWPVRVRAGAFGPASPARDLVLSPDHSVWLDATLIPVRHVVNGVTIVQEAVDWVEYWHVELPGHEVLVAEGLPVESYLDTGNRHNFADSLAAAMA